MKRGHARYYSAHERVPVTLTIQNPEYTTYESLRTCTPCGRSSSKYKPSYIPSTEAQQFLKQSIKCNLSRFLMTKIKTLSSKNDSQLRSYLSESREYVKSIEPRTLRVPSNKKRIAEPYLINHRQKLQRIILKKDENEARYQELCSRISTQVGKGESRVKRNEKNIHKKLSGKYHRSLGARNY